MHSETEKRLIFIGLYWDLKAGEDGRWVEGEFVGGEGICVDVLVWLRVRVCGFCAEVPLLGCYLFSRVVTRGNSR